MAAQLICNQWVAGSTPVTSSKKNPTIYRQNGGVYRGIFAFVCVANLSECALFVPYCSKNALSECLVLDARRRGRGGSGCEFAGGLGVAAARAGWCPPGAFPSQGRVQRIPVWLCAIGYGCQRETTVIGRNILITY